MGAEGTFPRDAEQLVVVLVIVHQAFRDPKSQFLVRLNEQLLVQLDFVLVHPDHLLLALLRVHLFIQELGVLLINDLDLLKQLLLLSLVVLLILLPHLSLLVMIPLLGHLSPSLLFHLSIESASHFFLGLPLLAQSFFLAMSFSQFPLCLIILHLSFFLLHFSI